MKMVRVGLLTLGLLGVHGALYCVGEVYLFGDATHYVRVGGQGIPEVETRGYVREGNLYVEVRDKGTSTTKEYRVTRDPKTGISHVTYKDGREVELGSTHPQAVTKAIQEQIKAGAIANVKTVDDLTALLAARTLDFTDEAAYKALTGFIANAPKETGVAAIRVFVDAVVRGDKRVVFADELKGLDVMIKSLRTKLDLEENYYTPNDKAILNSCIKLLTDRIAVKLGSALLSAKTVVAMNTLLRDYASYIKQNPYILDVRDGAGDTPFIKLVSLVKDNDAGMVAQLVRDFGVRADLTATNKQGKNAFQLLEEKGYRSGELREVLLAATNKQIDAHNAMTVGDYVKSFIDLIKGLFGMPTLSDEEIVVKDDTGKSVTLQFSRVKNARERSMLRLLATKLYSGATFSQEELEAIRTDLVGLGATQQGGGLKILYDKVDSMLKATSSSAGSVSSVRGAATPGAGSLSSAVARTGELSSEARQFAEMARQLRQQKG